MDEFGYDYAMSGDPGYGAAAMGDLAAGAYGGAPSAYDDFGNVQYGDLWYGGDTSWQDVYGTADEPIIPDDQEFQDWYNQQDLSPYPVAGGGTLQTYTNPYGQMGSGNLANGVAGGVSYMPPSGGTLQTSPNTVNPNLQGAGGLLGGLGQLPAASGGSTNPAIYDMTTLMPGFSAAGQGMQQQAALGGLLGGVADAGILGGQGGGGNAGNNNKPLNREELRKKQAAEFDAKKAIADKAWKDRQAQIRGQQPRGGGVQQGPPRMGQGGQARPPQMRQIPGMGGGGRAAGMPNLARPMPRGVGGVSGAAGGGGAAAAPKQNTAPLKQLLSEWKSSYQEAKKANEDRYAEILKGFRQNTVDVLGQNDTQAASAKEDVQRAYDRAAADAIQSARARGLSNTTVLDSLTRGVESDRQRATRGIENDRITRLTQLMNQLKNQELGFMERREDTYPSMEMMANLAREIGRADPNGTYDYAELLGTTKA